MTNAPTIVGIVGPTASGKTDLAMAVAERLGAEIIVADSRQVYRGMDIGTAKPPQAALDAVPHHGIDLADPDEPFSVTRWLDHARSAIAAIAERGRRPLLVGGTGLYVSALIDGHDYAAQRHDPELRAELDAELAASGLEPLAQRLRNASAGSAAQTDLRNPRRVVRALERGGAAVATRPYPGRVTLVGIRRPRDVLNARIDARARWLFENGLLDEVRALGARGYGATLRPMTGHGYAEAFRYLAGEWSLEEAIEVTVRRTRQYAKRQMTWFRHQTAVTWIDAQDEPADEPRLVGRALRALRHRSEDASDTMRSNR